jgi:hypothetical protein
VTEPCLGVVDRSRVCGIVSSEDLEGVVTEPRLMFVSNEVKVTEPRWTRICEAGGDGAAERRALVFVV